MSWHTSENVRTVRPKANILWIVMQVWQDLVQQNVVFEFYPKFGCSQ